MKTQENLEQISKICKKFLIKHDFGEMKSLKKLDEGFLNSLYEINDEFILKICGNPDLESNFTNGIKLIHHFQSKLPVPVIKEQDLTKKLIPNAFYFYEKIQGVPLSSIWHILRKEERENYIKQIVYYLKIINKSDLSFILERPKKSWVKLRRDHLQNAISQVEKNDLLEKSLISRIKSYHEDNWQILNQSLIVPVYWDVHLGNFLVYKSRLTGILDLESIEYLSIDFALDIIYRMACYPNLFLPAKYEKFCQLSDYKFVVQWFKKYYPELFNFTSLDERIKLYALEYDLKMFLNYPTNKSLKNRIKQIFA